MLLTLRSHAFNTRVCRSWEADPQVRTYKKHIFVRKRIYEYQVIQSILLHSKRFASQNKIKVQI